MSNSRSITLSSAKAMRRFRGSFSPSARLMYPLTNGGPSDWRAAAVLVTMSIVTGEPTGAMSSHQAINYQEYDMTGRLYMSPHIECKQSDEDQNMRLC